MEAEPRTLAVGLAWTEAHCVIPDGPRAGEPWHFYDYQLLYFANFYLVRPTAVAGELAPAFANRRGLLVGPQGLGKNPLIAAQICLEFVGPALFAGRAAVDEGYSCAEHGCGCGWEYAYDPGEPMGTAWATPLIQITAFSLDSTDNTYGALRPMIRLGPLAEVLPKAGEDMIRHPSGHENARIDTVTSSDRSRLGARSTFIPQDEVGLYTPETGMVRLADTQYRNLSKMGGRASLTTNAWDPSQRSLAQREFESAAKDVYRQFTEPPKALKFGTKAERRKIYQIVYPADTRVEGGGHVILDSIDAEAADLIAKDPAQAERFYGNRIVQGQNAAFDTKLWKTLASRHAHDVPALDQIVLGFDGSRLHDATALIATELATGYQWPLGIWYPERGQVPVDRVDAAVESAFASFSVWRMYADPPYWESWIATWSGRYGKERVIEWWTNRPKAMGEVLRAWSSAMQAGDVTHCPETAPMCALFSEHIGNAVRHDTGYRDDGGHLWTIEKPHIERKIDAAMAAALSWEARNDAIAAGALNTAEPNAEPFMFYGEDDDE